MQWVWLMAERTNCYKYGAIYLPLKIMTIANNNHHHHTHTHPFNGPLSGTTWVSWYQKGKTNLDFTEARNSEWQWQQLGHMQVCTSLQTDNHVSAPPTTIYRPLFQDNLGKPVPER